MTLSDVTLPEGTNYHQKNVRNLPFTACHFPFD
jgi:hypothetical protein